MIVKSLSKKGGTSNIFQYLVSESHVIGLSKDKPMIMTKNMRGESIAEYISELEEHNKARLQNRKNSISLYHQILSIHKDDTAKLNETSIKAIMQQFFMLRGENCKHVAIPHFEKDHFHIHIITSGTDLSGKAARQSKAEFQKMKVEIERFQRENYSELFASRIDHSKDKVNTTEIKKINGRTPVLSILNSKLVQLYDESKSIHEFRERIEKEGFATYNRDGKFQGLLVNGYKYRLSTIGFERPTINALDEFRNLESNVLGELESLRAARNESREIDRDEELERELKYDYEDTIEDESDDTDEFGLFDDEEF